MQIVVFDYQSLEDAIFKSEEIEFWLNDHKKSNQEFTVHIFIGEDFYLVKAHVWESQKGIL